MFIQIFTKSIRCSDTEFYLQHSHYLDCLHLETKHLVYKADSETQADILNVGFAMSENIKQDRKLGFTWHTSKKSDWYNLKHGISKKVWTEYNAGIKRNVTVYTENRELYNDLITGFTIADSLNTRLFLRVLKLKKDFAIGVGCLSESEITEQLREHWLKQYA
jgi:hypothetical protein